LHPLIRAFVLRRVNPRLRTFLVGLGASVLAVWVGTALAQENYFLASLSAGLCVWAVLAWTRGPRAEAWLLAFLIFGYVIGSRGFAQTMPFPGLPLFFSELGLGLALAMLLLRGALNRTLPFQRDWLNTLLLCWLVLGSGRIAWDVRTFGLLAVRDFAMVYYLLFFFVAQALAAHDASRTLLRQALLVTFGLLPITGALAVTFPDFFQANLLVQGVPLIFYKGDLLATFLFTGFIVLLPAGRFNYRTDALRWLLTIGSLVLGLSLLSRSSLLGLLVASAWLAWSGRWRALRVIAGVCLAGLLLVTVYSLLQKKDFTQTKAYAVYESAASIVDFQGLHRYQNEHSSNKGDNNRFRLVWWRNVAEETLKTSPVFGLGFGADLARGFLTEYYPTADTDFSARSPHNIFMTTLGRMGLLGVAGLLAIYWVQARITARVGRAARRDPAQDETITLQAAAWVIMVSACLGVVLEGPMGAMPFWTLLGLAHHAATRATADNREPTPPAQA
jgi:hypothetical protein